MSNDSTSSGRDKKAPRKRKSRSQFPLSKHPRGYWCKRYKTTAGEWKMAYFGKVADDPERKDALDQWVPDKDELVAGRVPRSKRDDATVKTVVNEFLNWKRELVQTGELADGLLMCTKKLESYQSQDSPLAGNRRSHPGSDRKPRDAERSERFEIAVHRKTRAKLRRKTAGIPHPSGIEAGHG